MPVQQSDVISAIHGIRSTDFDIGPQTTFEDAGLDSIGIIQFVMHLEVDCGIEVPDGVFSRWTCETTVQDVCDDLARVFPS